MDSLTLENFRCFHERQTARLAPLTLLVGENSTGKTSFLAMVRAMHELIFARVSPDFKKEPYDLGSFDEIANYRGGKAGRADEFSVELEYTEGGRRGGRRTTTATFRKEGTAPHLVGMKIRDNSKWVEQRLDQSKLEVCFGAANGSWKKVIPNPPLDDDEDFLFPLWSALRNSPTEGYWSLVDASEPPSEQDIRDACSLVWWLMPIGRRSRQTPFASAPVRSQPRRTYDPTRADPDPEGTYVPMLYADMHFRRPDEWQQLKAALESFGREAGLFDELVVRPLGKRGTEPFQLQVRKSGGRIKGPRRNLIDVGYGVSQVLPVLTELFHKKRPRTFLLQQPEVHLHPSAQAALGSLFCQIASRERQLIVETHSDYLLDRVRMDIRDGEGKLKPEDVSILYFERQDIDVKIHSIRLDKEGNVLDAPPSYGRFFMDEVGRSIRRRPDRSQG